MERKKYNMKKRTIKLLLLNTTIFFVSFILGNGLFFNDAIHTPGEVTSNTIPFSIIVTIVGFITTYILYKKDKIFSEKRFINIKKSNYSINVYEKVGATRIDKDFEKYFNHEKQKYNFPMYKLVKVVKAKPNQYIEFYLSELLTFNKYVTSGTLIITSEFNGVEYDPNTMTSVSGNRFAITLPSKIEFEGLRNKTEKDRIITLKNEIKKEDNNRVNLNNQKQKELEDREKKIKLDIERELKFKEMGLTTYQIERIIEFYTRKLVSKNWISSGYGFSGTEEERIEKYNNVSLLSNETELDLFLSKNDYVLAFNPYVEEDCYTVGSSEIQILNDLGLLTQSEVFPYFIKVKDIRIEKNWKNLSKGNSIELKLLDNSIEKEVIKNGYEFEEYVARLLEKNGFIDVQVSKGSGDQGVDIFATSLNKAKYGFQTKYYTGSVGNQAVQEIISGVQYFKLNVGVVVTNSTFTNSAKKLAESSGILLWDYEKLKELESK